MRHVGPTFVSEREAAASHMAAAGAAGTRAETAGSQTVSPGAGLAVRNLACWRPPEQPVRRVSMHRVDNSFRGVTIAL
jgi:hypothetical protein